MKRLTTSLAVVGAVVGSGVVATLPSEPAGATACVNRVTTWQAYNECAAQPARHWDAIRNASSKYGNWASKKHWSKQSACWINVVSYGYSLKA